MRAVQVSLTQGRECGIALFASDLEAAMAGSAVEFSTATSTDAVCRGDAPDVVVLQHHEELISDSETAQLRLRWPGPLVLLAHSGVTPKLLGLVDGVMSMVPVLPGDHPMPNVVFSLPAWVPPALSPRRALRSDLGHSPDMPTVGTCGFLKFDRQLDEIAQVLLPTAIDRGWRIQILASPWRLESPGLLDRLEVLRAKNPQNLTIRYEYLPCEELNRHLQACDLLWCWTREPSSEYASGVASVLYASGSRVVASEKLQHDHILGLPNVVRAPPDLPGFLTAVQAEMTGSAVVRHDPTPISWDAQVGRVASFLLGFAPNPNGRGGFDQPSAADLERKDLERDHA